jgi:hypothetical protein
VVSLSIRRAIVAALAATLVAVPSLDATAAQQRTKEQAQAPERYRTGYTEWRERLQRHDLFVGRELLPRARTADGTARPASKTELRRSIWRMQKRWGRWLHNTPRGRSFAFRQKVSRHVPAWGRAHLRSIAACESHNNPRAVGGGGTYRGLYQFSFSTWSVVGGSGDPAAASRGEQTWRAWLLLSRHGAGHWPVCG